MLITKQWKTSQHNDNQQPDYQDTVNFENKTSCILTNCMGTAAVITASFYMNMAYRSGRTPFLYTCIVYVLHIYSTATYLWSWSQVEKILWQILNLTFSNTACRLYINSPALPRMLTIEIILNLLYIMAAWKKQSSYLGEEHTVPGVVPMHYQTFHKNSLTVHELIMVVV
jgi:hypothetical protein